MRRDPALLNFAPAGFPVVVGPYLAAADRFGSPAYSASELRGRDERTRQGADLILARSLGLRLQAVADAKRRGCRKHPGGAVELPRGGAALRSQRAAQVALARFSTLPFIPLGGLAADRFAELRIPPDHAPEPWRASLDSGAPITVCSP